MGFLVQLKKKFDDVADAVTGRQYKSPVPQPQRVPILQNMVNTVQRPFNYFNPESNGGKNFWTSSVGDALVKAQNSIESSNPINIIPRVNINAGKTTGQKIANEMVNLPGSIANSFINVPASLGSDVARYMVQGDKFNYNNAKSPFSRLAMNIEGQQRTPQQVVGNLAGAAGQVLDVYTPSFGKDLVKKGLEKGSMNLIPVLVKGAKSGAIYGGAQGALSGLSENRNNGGKAQIKGAVEQGTSGALLGSLLGAGTSGAGAILEKLISPALRNKILNKKPLTKQEQKIVDSYVRDVKGRFSKGQAKIKPIEFISDAKISDKQRGDLRKKLNLSQAGFIDFSENPEVPTFKEPYQRGDIKKIDEVLNKELGVTPSGNSKKDFATQQYNLKQLQHYAERGDSEAQQIVDKIKKIEQQKTLAQNERLYQDELKNGKVVKTIGNVKVRDEAAVPTRNNIVDQASFNPNDPFGDFSKPTVEAPKKLSDVELRKRLGELMYETRQQKVAREMKSQDPFIQELDNYQKTLTPKAGKTKTIPKKELPFDNVDNQAQDTGRAEYQAMTEPGKFKKMFARFIGNREATGNKALAMGKKYDTIPEKDGMAVINAIEYPERKVNPAIQPYVASLKNEYERLYQDAKKQGVDIGKLDNYVTHIWNIPENEVKLMYKTLGTKFKFSKKRKVPTYEEGLKMDLIPKYTKPAQIIADYTHRLEKVKANIQFLNDLKREGLVVPSSTGSRTPGFKPILAPGFPQSMTTTGEKVYSGPFYAPASIADTINSAFDSVDTGILGKAAGISGKIQDFTLAGGIPTTPVNAFTLAQTQKELTSGRIVAPIKAMVRSMFTGKSNAFFEGNAEQIAKMQQRNISIKTSADIHSFLDDNELAKTFGEKAKRMWNSAFNDPTFKRFIPMLQIEFFNDAEKRALKQGMSPEQAADVAAEATKNFYGIIGSDVQATRNPYYSDAVSTFFFAPKYRESMINFWLNNLKAISPVKRVDGKLRVNNPLSVENRANTQFMVGSLITAAGMNYLNEIFNGRGMLDNPAGKQDKLLIPLGQEKDSTVLGIPFQSSIATMPRMAMSIAGDVATGNFTDVPNQLKTSLSSLVRTPVDVLTNENYFGQPIYDENSSGIEKAKDIGAYMFGQYNHPYVRLLMSRIVPQSNGKIEPLYQSLSKTAELPIRFYTNKSVNAGYYYQAKDQAMKGLSDQEVKAMDMIPKYENDPLNSMMKYQIYARYPNVFNAQRQIALETAKRNNEIPDPLYMAQPEIAKRYIAASMLPPGSKEKSQLYKAFPELGILAEMRGQYFDSHPIEGQAQSNRPVASTYVQQQMAAKNWKDPQVQAYFLQRDAWNNVQRERLGLLPVGGSSQYGSGKSKKGGNKKSKKQAFRLRLPVIKTPKVAITIPKATKEKPKSAKVKVKAIDIYNMA